MTTLNVTSPSTRVLTDLIKPDTDSRGIMKAPDPTQVENQVLSASALPWALPHMQQLMSTEDWTSREKELAFEVFKRTLDEPELDRPGFDPGAWENHVGVLLDAVIAMNVARLANAQLRGHYTLVSAEAAKAQGEAIREAGDAQLKSAFSGAAVNTVFSLSGAALNLKGLAGKHADISVHKRNAMEAGNIAGDLQVQRARSDFEPGVPTQVRTLDDAGKPGATDFTPKGRTASPEELAWFDSEIQKAQKQVRQSEWQSLMNEKGYLKPQLYGQLLSSLAATGSNAVSSMVRLDEYAARERELQQQSAHTITKGLADEVGQKDAADSNLLNKLMEMVLQIMQSRAAASAIR
ncbi:IpaC/SipC family type III secretion system effector [Pseudomonas alkylphenolica]|uniref:IpaC/SipC family type III secretion system effector n=1 Tax=Pseudomonas alkylphenolica TaxID=237609 RepID=UPI0018D6FAB4|nr:IpaC/SipC family type III secretion system effector [Pseudomonas alkylphenolica]MBH3427335.1 cell invasion protein [Pseudomonas alkylphenolica]